MLFEFALLASAAAPAFSGEFGGYHFDRTTPNRWERFDLVLTNETDETETVGTCPKQAEMVLKTTQASRSSAFAIKFEDDSWSFGCSSRSVQPGESITLSLYFRTAFEGGERRDIFVETSAGDFVITR
uniref:hypothetical protein n=1 Tax=uncultured Erythrobacter sp. TaxID=263913 RepID=UPI00261B7044|nr:hypothetical protein [uncultured Erythrobacter sp.]